MTGQFFQNKFEFELLFVVMDSFVN